MRAPVSSGLDLAASVPPLGEVLELLRVIWSVDHALQKASKRMHSTLGVTGPQRLVIRMVGRFPGIAAAQLAEILHIHPSTLTGILKRLEKQGLLSRRPHPRDARRAFLGLTQRGREVDANTAGTVEAAVEGAIAGLSPTVLRHTRQLLNQLAEALESGRG